MEADYTDSYTAIVKNSHRINAKELFNLMFVHHPKPIQYLLKLRDQIVKPFGIKRSGGFTEFNKRRGRR